jgi:hypothetical protein
MNATGTPAPIPPPHLSVVGARMSEAEYDVERAKLAPDKATAGMRWEQGLAALFYRSGWTQDELAKKEKKTQSYVGKMLRFGRFMTFSSAGLNLTERRFRDYWDRTAEHGSGNERIRFAAIMKLIEGEEPLRMAHTPKGYPKKIVAEFGDTKWHSLPIIAKHLDASEDEIEPSLLAMKKHGWGGASTEMKTVGTIKYFRFFKNARMVSSTELTEKLAPIIEGLEAEGKKSMATMAPAAVAILANKLRKLLVEWAE